MQSHEHVRDAELREIHLTHASNISPQQEETAPNDPLIDTRMYGGLRSFPTFWTTSALSYLAYTILQIALPLFAQQMTRSPLLVSGISAVRTFPFLAFSLFAGMLVDFYDRRFLWILVTLLRLLVVGTAIIAAVSRYIPLLLLYVLALVFGLAQTLEELALAAALPMLVPRGKLEFANSWLVGAQNLIELLATPLTGMLVTMGIVLTTGIDGFAIIASLVALLFLQGSFRPPRSVKHHILVNMLEGVRFLWRSRVLQTIAIMAAVINACWSGYLAVLVLYVIKPGPVGLTDIGYSLLITCRRHRRSNRRTPDNTDSMVAGKTLGYWPQYSWKRGDVWRAGTDNKCLAHWRSRGTRWDDRSTMDHRSSILHWSNSSYRAAREG